MGGLTRSTGTSIFSNIQHYAVYVSTIGSCMPSRRLRRLDAPLIPGRVPELYGLPALSAQARREQNRPYHRSALEEASDLPSTSMVWAVKQTSCTERSCLRIAELKNFAQYDLCSVTYSYPHLLARSYAFLPCTHIPGRIPKLTLTPLPWVQRPCASPSSSPSPWLQEPSVSDRNVPTWPSSIRSLDGATESTMTSIIMNLRRLLTVMN